MTKNKFALIIHGGVGTIIKENMTAKREAAYLEILKISLLEGEKILINEGSENGRFLGQLFPLPII